MGTRLGADVKKRGKFVIQWNDEQNGRDRVWDAFPAEEELHSDLYLWKSWKQRRTAPFLQLRAKARSSAKPWRSKPAASLPPQQAEEESEATERGERQRRKWHALDRYRAFVDTSLQAARLCVSCCIFHVRPLFCLTALPSVAISSSIFV